MDKTNDDDEGHYNMEIRGVNSAKFLKHIRTRMKDDAWQG
jgi:hypothetical protein